MPVGSNDVKIIISAVDRASKEMQKVTGSGDKMKKNFEGVGKALGIAGVALGTMVTIGSGVKKLADETLEYANQVRSLVTAIGASPEEASKLIQVADDMGISFDTLTTGLEAGIRKGIKPTIENLGILSDKYLELEPGVERTKFLMDSFGRSGADLARIMELGSTKITEMGDSIEGTGRLMSQEGLDAAEEYRMSLDEMGDSFTDLKMTIGMAVIPALNDLFTWFNNLFISAEKMTGSIENQGEAVMDTGGSYEDYIKKVQDASREFGYSIIETDDGLRILNASGMEVSHTMDIMSQAEFDAKQKSDALAAGMKNAEMRGRGYKVAIDEATTATDELKAAEDELKQKMDELHLFIDGPVGKSLDEHEKKQAAVQTAINKVTQEIASLEKMQYRTPEQDATLKDLKDQQDILQQEFADNATAHAEAHAKIMFNLLEQSAAVDGLSTTEGEALAAIALDWGLVDQATYDAYGTAQEFMAGLQAGLPLTAADLEGIANKLLGLPTEKTITVTINETTNKRTVWIGGTESGHGRQHGGPVYAGEMYRVGEAGPEQFIPWTNGVILPNSYTTNNTFNLTGNYGYRSESDLIQQVQLLAAMYG